MTVQPKLAHLEDTLGQLAIDVLQSRYHYHDLVMSGPINQQAEYLPDAVHVTRLYAEALIAEGFTLNHDEMHAVYFWLTEPFGLEGRKRIDTAELHRLEGVLLLGPEHDIVMPRIKSLCEQRLINNHNHFVISGSNQQPGDTLWAIRALTTAAKCDTPFVQQDATPEHLLALLEPQLDQLYLDDDLALVLNLFYRLMDGKPDVERLKPSINQICDAASKNKGLWYVNQNTEWLIGHMIDQRLAPVEVADHREDFREMILRSCKIIQMLAPLRPLFPDTALAETLDTAMKLWWNTFAGERAHERLLSFFPRPYDLDYLKVLYTTVITLRAYLGQPLREWNWSYGYRRYTDTVIYEDDEDESCIKDALRKWLKVELDGKPQSLNLGMSDTNVVRVQPYIAKPGEDDNGRLYSGDETVVVKFGPAEEIERERKSYANLPAKLKSFCVRLPDTVYHKGQRAFVIIPDLRNYSTLYELLHRQAALDKSLPAELATFLVEMHRGGMPDDVRPMAPGRLADLYFIPMYQQAERVFNYLRYIENNQASAGLKPEIDYMYEDFHTRLGDLIRHQGKLEGLPVAYMHGDLNTRNIMIRPNRGYGHRFDFKLIDLEKFENEGDAAIDAGEFWVDLRVITTQNPRLAQSDSVKLLRREMDAAYQAFAQKRGDDLFGIRLLLAQGRMLIRVAKGRVKFGNTQLEQNQFEHARDIANEILIYMRESIGLLGDVVGELENVPD
jgi:hypothetical protein